MENQSFHQGNNIADHDNSRESPLPSTSTALSNGHVTTKQPIPPTPPRFLEYLEKVDRSPEIFQRIPVDPLTPEWSELVRLLHPISIKSAEQIVNPEVWARFDRTRKDLFLSKSDDRNLLSSLGLDERDVARAVKHSKGFVRHPSIQSSPYSDNMSLLFHCTRSQSGVDSILREGLDDRQSSDRGRFGSGIYLSDNPLKAMKYHGGTGVILICAVLLGDCLTYDSWNNGRSFNYNRARRGLVREPEKDGIQKRNACDTFFDSVTGSSGKNNEFVIFNRGQCYPMYAVQIDLSAHAELMGFSFPKTGLDYWKARENPPTIAWGFRDRLDVCALAMPPAPLTSTWPFLASYVFGKMEPYREDDQSDNIQESLSAPQSINNVVFVNQLPEVPPGPLPPHAVLQNLRSSLIDRVYKQRNVPPRRTSNPPQSTSWLSVNNEAIKGKLAALVSLGFTNEYENRKALKMFNNDLNDSAVFLLDHQKKFPSTSLVRPSLPDEEATSSSHSLQSRPSGSADSVNSGDGSEPMDFSLGSASDQRVPATIEQCLICCNDYESNGPLMSTTWKTLPCSHKVCVNCYLTLCQNRTTMSGQTHSFLKCPFCGWRIGTELGNCPDGRMNVDEIPLDCEGFPGCGTIRIQYSVRGPSPLRRVAYLPNNQEGKEVVALLRVAWDRRLCFVFGTSATTGRENVLVWNIHHKTNQVGGVSCHGFPDPGYFSRVKLELKQYGIE